MKLLLLVEVDDVYAGQHTEQFVSKVLAAGMSGAANEYAAYVRHVQVTAVGLVAMLQDVLPQS